MSAQNYQQLITQLASAAKAVHLYPPQHQARTQPLYRIGGLLEQILSRFEVCYVAIEEEILVVNGEPFFDPFPGYAELIDRMIEREVVRIEFQRGVGAREIQILVALLAMPADDLVNWDSPRAFLEHQEVAHIEVELEEEDLELRALQVYTEAKDYIVHLWDEARLGNIPRGDKARETMNELSLLMAEDPNLLLGLTMLSDYDNYTFNHSVNVGVFALSLAEALGFDTEKDRVGLGGMLHDVGKTQIPIEVINKPGRLTDEEWALMRAHPEISGDIVEQMGLSDIFETVFQHHCGYNRAGYPALPHYKDLSEGGLITAVCDIYDSVTTLRPYQRQHTPQEGIQILLKLKSREHLHPEFVDTFVRMLGIYPVGTAVRLNTGEVALVAGINREVEDRPRVKIVRDARGNVLRIPIELDLATEGSGKAGGRQRRVVGTLDPAAIGIRPSDYLDPNQSAQQT